MRSALLSPAAARFLERYLRRSRRPLTALLFLLPGVIAYETWALRWLWQGGDRDLVAHVALRGLLEWFGVVTYAGPGLVLVAALVAQHRLRHERLDLRPSVLPLMALESLILAAPLWGVSGLLAPVRIAEAQTLGTRLFFALGAGIYEELVFRLLLIAGLAWLGARLARLDRHTAANSAAPLAALVFAACHFPPIGVDAFSWSLFWFRFVAGLYLGLLYVRRGVGIAGGAHAAFNIACVLFR